MKKKNNVRGEVQHYNKFPIEAHLTEGSRVLTFDDPTSIERMIFMSTGDQIIGNAIPDDVFIEHIDLSTHEVEVSIPMEVTLTEVVDVLCKVQYYPKESKEFWKYRIQAAKDGVTNEGMLNHLDSSYRLLPALDVSKFRDGYLTRLQGSVSFRDEFNKACRALYKRTPSLNARPSAIISEGDLLLDINAWMTFEDGGLKIFSQKTLDYFEEYHSEIARVSDALKIGVSINGISRDGLNPTIDEAIQSKFRKTRHWGEEAPYFIKIGTGILPDSAFDVGDDDEREQQPASYYGDDHYGDAYWSTRQGGDEKVEPPEDIAEPLFSSVLSEYEIDRPSPDWTSIQFAVMRRAFSNFKVDSDVNVQSTRLKSLDVFSICLDEDWAQYSSLCYYCGRTVTTEDLTEQKSGFLNYYSLDPQTYVFSDGEGGWIKKKARVFTGSLNSVKTSKDDTYVFFCEDDKAALFIKGNFVVLSYFKNVYYPTYEGAPANTKDSFIHLNLGVTDIVKGSYNATWILREQLETSGYEYTDDGLKPDYTKPVDHVSLVEDYVYCDEANEVLYTYNGDKKLMICQENNKYFKNIINNVVSFTKKSAFTTSGLVTQYYLEGLDGFDFDIDKMSLGDEILSIEEIDIRHPYEQTNEPVMFSNYQTVKLYMRGLFCSDDELDLNSGLNFNFGYKFKMNPKSAIQKSRALIEEKNIKPFNKAADTQYEDEILDYGVSSFEGTVVPSPEYIESTFTDEQNVIEGFEFYKSLLVLEGKVDLKEPTRIAFEIQQSLDALDVIQNGDEVTAAIYLSPTSQTGYSEPYTVIEDVKVLDHKNNVFCIGAKTGVYFFNCDDISSFETKDRPFAKITFDDGDILTSLVWDSVRACWIYSLEVESDGSFAGCYSVKSVYNEEEAPIIEQVQEFDQAMNSQDVNTYQFIRPLRTTDSDILAMTEQDDLLYDEERFLARDFSLRNIDKSLIEQMVERISELKIEKNKEYYLDLIGNKLPTSTDWIELDFDMIPTGKDSLSIEGPGCGYYVYDKSLGKWQYSTSNVYNFIAKNISERTHAHVTIVDKKITTGNYLYENGHAITKTEYFTEHDGAGAEGGVLAQFLWIMPRPGTNKNECSIVVVADDPKKLWLFTSHADMKLRGVTIKSKKLIKGDLYELGSDGRLKPHYENGFWADYGDKRLVMAYNSDGYMAVLNGDTLFIKSPTTYWKPTNDEYWPSGKTKDFFWKKAQIPSQKDLSYLLFSTLSIDEAYHLVCQQKEQYVTYLEKLSSKDEIQKALLTWLKDPKNDPIIPERALEIIESAPDGYDYTTSFEMKGVEFLQSPNGVYVNVNPVARQQYVIPQNIAIQAGVTVEAQVREETYLQYLRDYYEIILGCNRLSNLLEESVKSMKLTSQDLILVTKTDDVLTLPLDCTDTRDNIENYNNWEVHSIAPSKEVPTLADANDGSTYDYTVGLGDEIGHYTTSMQLHTRKLYTITSSYVERNVQVYGGWYRFDQEAINFYGKAGASTEDIAAAVGKGTFQRPFVSYSQDGGATFQELDLVGISGFSFAAYDAFVSAIYRIGNFIRIAVSDGNGKVETTDLKIDLAGVQYNLTSTANFTKLLESDNEYEISTEFTDAGLINDVTPYAITKPHFYLAIAKSTAFTGKIVAKDLESITIEANGTGVSTPESEEVPVLIAIHTAKSIANQWNYLRAHDARYFTDYGELKVPYIEQVLSQDDANFLYSKNETLPASQQDETAITAFNFDVNKTVYWYDEAFDGQLVPKKMSNAYNDPIYLIDVKTGRFLLNYNPENIETEALTFKEMVDDHLDGQVLVQATNLSADFMFLGNNFGVTDFFKRMTDFVAFKRISFSPDNPYLLVSVKGDGMAESVDAGLFYVWPEELADVETDDQLAALIDGGVSFFEKLKELVSDGITVTKEWLTATFEKVKIVSGTSSFYGVREISTGTVLTKELVSCLTVALPYESYNDQSIFYGQPLLTNNDGLLARSNGKSVCTISLGIKGYGADIDLEEWNDHGPAELDKAAFGTRLLKNDINNYVYLSDPNGTKLIMRNGQFDMNVSETGTISYQSLHVKAGTVHVRVYRDDHHVDLAEDTIEELLFHKIQESSLSVYCPQGVVHLEGLSGTLTLARAYFSDVDVSADCTLTCATKLYEDANLTKETNVRWNYSNSTISYERDSDKPVFSDGDYLAFVLTHKNGKNATFKVKLSQISVPKVVSAPFVLVSTVAKELVLELDRQVSSFSLSGSAVLIKSSKKRYTLKILGPEGVTIITDGQEIKLDIHLYEPRLLLSHAKGMAKAAVYSHELDVTDQFEIKDNGNGVVTATSEKITLRAEYTPSSVKVLSDVPFVWTQLSQPVNYTVSENAVITGLCGYYILNEFAFNSFKDLTTSLERKIYGRRMICERGEAKFLEINDANVRIDRDLLTGDDNGTRYFILKVLPIQTFYPDVSTMNNPEYFTQVSVHDIAMFGYDRVWTNPSLFKPAPFEYEGQFYNGESMSQYSVDTWKNKDGFKVWLADTNGYFVKPVTVGEDVLYERIGNEEGDCSSEIYQSHEARINPCELLYKTAYDYYKSRYYEKGLKVNPFLVKWRCTSHKEEGRVAYDSYFFRDVVRRRQLAEDLIDGYFVDDLDINYDDSSLTFSIYHDFVADGTDKDKFFYGIKYNNVYADDTAAKIDAGLETLSNFVIDSLEDTENDDAPTVADITEMGIFSKQGHLLAYMSHPVCQYDTKKNYIAYNLLLNRD